MSPPLSVVPGGLDPPAAPVLAYLRDLRRGSAQLAVPRVMVVGFGGAGKTTTAHVLMRPEGSRVADLASASSALPRWRAMRS